MFKIPFIKGSMPRILLISQDYFIIPELLRAMQKCRVDFCTVEFAQNTEFLKNLFDQIAAFRPHFILSINHSGLDGDGQVLALLGRCGVPFASWFVDRPEMFMQNDVAPDALLSVFCWDPQSIPFFKAKGIREAHYLPLATDPTIFRPQPPAATPKHAVSFVGSSWANKIADLLRAARFPAPLLREYRKLGKIYATTPDVARKHLCEEMNAETRQIHAELPVHSQNMFYRLIQLEGTRQQRIQSVSELLDFSPVIVGDSYWKQVLTGKNKKFSWWSRLDYEQELPAFYRDSAVNFNSPSLQSSAAMNQRVFDVPACGSFLLTRYCPELEELFEPEKEVACYQGLGEIKERVSEWLENSEGRKETARAGLKRVLAEHTYEHRLAAIIRKMKIYF
ncbi:glycosyltransferase [Desulfovibrio sp. JC010]|uniref:CgeB family protein n=1 Tax=Desulfovibrio sp. JC010 TaxID=2593641 RepID=UPI0013D892B3|nr:glycosyltransferase [Desulfovibrio sp. JC010]NDV27319.1 glycosyltransferase [Desulfovibrio sp. JC010]